MSSSREWVVGGMVDGRVAPLHTATTPTTNTRRKKRNAGDRYDDVNGDVVHLPYTSADELEVVEVPLTGALGEAVYDPAATPDTIRTIRTNMAAAKLIYHLQSTTPRRRHDRDDVTPQHQGGGSSSTKGDRERELERRLQQQ